jgi:hypothetical protein
MNPKPKSKRYLQGGSVRKRRDSAVRKLKKLPKFKNDKEEFKFWSTHDSTEYIDCSKGKRVLFSNLKPGQPPFSIII